MSGEERKYSAWCTPSESVDPLCKRCERKFMIGLQESRAMTPPAQPCRKSEEGVNGLKHFAGIKDTVRIERRLERPHQIEGDGIFDMRQQTAFQPADAMLG